MSTKETFELKRYRDVQRFIKKVDQRQDGCWIWTAACDHRGLPYFHLPGNKKRSARRIAYAFRFGQPPIDMIMVPSCGNRLCVQPHHMLLVPMGQRRPRTHCRRGHKFRPQTTYITTQGKRTCRICMRQQQRRRARSSKSERELEDELLERAEKHGTTLAL